jgi:hypothetical protein
MIAGIAFAIATLGALLLLVLYARIRAVDEDLKLKKHRSRMPGWPTCSTTPRWSTTA